MDVTVVPAEQIVRRLNDGSWVIPDPLTPDAPPSAQNVLDAALRMLRGIPMGMITVHNDWSADFPRRHIIDGVKRATLLQWVCSSTRPADPHRRFAIKIAVNGRADFHSRKGVGYSIIRATGNPWELPLNDIWTTKNFLAWVRDLEDTQRDNAEVAEYLPKHIRWAEDVTHAMKGYHVPVYTITSDVPSDLRTLLNTSVPD